MFALNLISWWYGQGWALLVRNSKKQLISVAHLFSLPILVRTLFAPWRRIVTYPGASLEARLHALGDNIFSRLIGLVVRLGVLFVAGLILGLTALVEGIMIWLWPFVPLAIPVCLILAVIV